MGLVALLALWASAIDARERRLPNRLLGPMALAALDGQLLRALGGPWLWALPWLRRLDPVLAPPANCVFLGLLLGFGLAVVEYGYRHIARKCGLGFGDIKLVGCWTFALGVWGVVALFLGCTSASLWALLHHQRTFPLGPWISGWALALAVGLAC